MRIDRFERHEVTKGVLNHLECESCRNEIETYYIYTLLFAPNNNNGKYVVLCGDCAKELKDILEKKLKCGILTN